MIIWDGIKLSLKENCMHLSKIEYVLMVRFGKSRVVKIICAVYIYKNLIETLKNF